MPGSGRSFGGGNGHLLQYSLPGKFHGQRSLADHDLMGLQRVGHNVHCAHAFRFPIYNITSTADSDSFTSSFLAWVTFISFMLACGG